MNSSTSSSDRLWLRVFAATVAVLCGIFFLATEILIRTRIEPRDLFAEHRRLFFRSDKTSAVFGDSHSAQDFTGAEEFVNLSFPGESIEVLASKIKLYFAKRRPGRIILQADPHMLSKYREETPSKEIVAFYERNSGPLWLAGSFRHRKFLFYYWFVFLSGKKFKTKFSFNADGSQTVEGRWRDHDSEEQFAAEARQRVRLQVPQKDFERSAGFEQYRAILDDLKNKGADVCLVTFPVAREYAGEAGRYPEFEAARRAFKNLAGRYGFSYRDYSSAVKDPDLFSNEDHMNKNGALRLTQLILKDCFSHR